MSCAGCDLGMLEFHRLHGNELLEFLRRHNVILSEKICPKCGGVCEISSQSGSEFFFVCRASAAEQKGKKKNEKIQCSFQESVRVNTFFAGSRFPIEDICRFAVLDVAWLKRMPRFMESELKWSHQSVVDWDSRLRAAYIDWSLSNSRPSIKVPKTVERDGARFRFFKTFDSHRVRNHEIFMAIGRVYNPSNPVAQDAVDLDDVD
ncbi:hypothetical protein ACLKA6_018144 [Drosophila palustris]